MEAKAGVHILSGQDDLVDSLSQELLRFSAEDLKDVLIILPTQRLGQYLLAMLGQANTTFLAPTIWTLETFIQRHSPQMFEGMTTLSPGAEELLLASLLRQNTFKHLQKGHEHEIREFFSQILQAGIGESAFAQLKQLIQKDIYRDEEHIGSLVERVSELQILYHQYGELLRSKKAIRSEALAIASVKKMLESFANDASLQGWRWVYVACFTTTKHYCRPLLRALSQKNNVSMLFSEAPKLLGSHSPLGDLLEYIVGAPVPCAQEDLVVDRERTHVLALSTRLEETKAALATIRSYLEQGCPPSRIGLLVSDERSYGKILAMLLEKESFRTNLAIAQPFAESALGSWLIVLIQYLARLSTNYSSQEQKKEDLRALRNFVCHPLSARALVENHEDAQAQIDLHYDLAKGEDGISPEWMSLLTRYLEPYSQLSNTRKPQLLSQWQSALARVIDNFGILAKPDEFKRSDIEAFEQFNDFLEQWALVWEGKVSGRECLFAMLDKVQSLETRSVGFPLEGVQVLDIIEARYVPFEVVIILGCTEGRFPRSLPNDRLVSDLLKVKLGMPGWQYIEALEDTTFHRLCSQARYLTFLYSVNPDYGSICRSRFIERLLAQDQAQLVATQQDTKVQLAEASLALPADDEVKGNFEGARSEFFQQVSASSLSQLFRCPYQFLLSKLGVQKKADEAPSLWEGRWLHEILEAFYSGQLQTEQVLPALADRILLRDEEIVPFALERLRVLTDFCLPDNIKGSPFYLHLMHFSWPRFAHYWASLFEPKSNGTSVFAPLYSFKEYTLAGKGLPLRQGTQKWASVLGTLDSLDCMSNRSVLVDYKRKGVDTLVDVVQGLAPQLPLYALAMAQNRFEEDRSFLDSCLVGYWSIVEGRWQARGVGDQVRTWALDKKLASAQTPSLSHLVDNLQLLWSETTQMLLQEAQAFSPVESDACKHCAFKGICRVGG